MGQLCFQSPQPLALLLCALAIFMSVNVPYHLRILPFSSRSGTARIRNRAVLADRHCDAVPRSRTVHRWPGTAATWSCVHRGHPDEPQPSRTAAPEVSSTRQSRIFHRTSRFTQALLPSAKVVNASGRLIASHHVEQLLLRSGAATSSAFLRSARSRASRSARRTDGTSLDSRVFRT